MRMRPEVTFTFYVLQKIRKKFNLRLAFFSICVILNKSRLYGQAVKTPPSHGGNSGSNPDRVTTQKLSLCGQLFSFLLPCFSAVSLLPLLLAQLAFSTKVKIQPTSS